jgi:hypothetical protein
MASKKREEEEQSELHYYANARSPRQDTWLLGGFRVRVSQKAKKTSAPSLADGDVLVR